MYKNKFITSLLLVAFTIVLAHSIIPHHHYDGNNNEFAYSSQSHDEENSLQHSFEMYGKSTNTADYFLPTNHYVPLFDFYENVNTATQSFIFSNVIVIIDRKYNHYLPPTLSTHYLFSLPFRGPPVI